MGASKTMGQSLTKVYVHIVFSTKNRENLIDKLIEIELFEYIGGVCKGMKCNPIQVGGYRNHIHVLCLLAKDITQSQLLEEIKKRSSKWIKTKGQKYQNFYWQNGYGIFSVNPSQIDIVKNYITNQEKHHSIKTFKSEFRSFMEENKIEFNEKYVWD